MLRTGPWRREACTRHGQAKAQRGSQPAQGPGTELDRADFFGLIPQARHLRADTQVLYDASGVELTYVDSLDVDAARNSLLTGVLTATLLAWGTEDGIAIDDLADTHAVEAWLQADADGRDRYRSDSGIEIILRWSDCR